MTQLARAQERELRSWLYAGPADTDATLAAAVAEAAHEVEDLHGTPIDVVSTGDRPLDDGGQALIRAVREALLNAVRHGEPPVSLYLEVGPRGSRPSSATTARGSSSTRCPRTAWVSASPSSAGWTATGVRRGCAGSSRAPRWPLPAAARSPGRPQPDPQPATPSRGDP